MCGIFAYSGNQKNAGDIVLNGLKSLEYRGYDSWGVALKKTDETLHTEQHVGKIGDAKLPTIDTQIGIGHTRWATHGGVTERNAHPHIDCKQEVVVVHNGIVENFSELKKELASKGHTFISETDSEVIPHLIEEMMKTETDIRKVIFEAYKRLNGMNAFIVFIPKTNQFFAIKNGSPIVFSQEQGNYFLASDSSALAPHTKKAYFLEDNEMLEVNKDTVHLYTLDNKKKDIQYTQLNFDHSDVSLGEFEHYMIKEIYDQPKVLQNIIDTQIENIKEAAELIRKSYGSYLIACGTASYACIAGTYLFSKIAKRHINASIASEFGYQVDFLNDKSLVIPLSQSGETIDLISSIKDAKRKNVKVMAITNGLGSTLYRLADYKLLLNAGPEKAVASTKAYTAKIAFLYLLAFTIAGNIEKGVTYLQAAISELKAILQRKEQIKHLADRLKNVQHMFIIGRGVSYATALESSLKIKEVSYIHSEGFAAGELKHGVIALIEKGTPVIVYNPDDETYADTLSSAYEVKARGAYVIGISNKNNEVFDEFIEVKDCKDATIIPNVVVAQLLGYYLAIGKKLDPDKPRNLAKSVVVK